MSSGTALKHTVLERPWKALLGPLPQHLMQLLPIAVQYPQNHLLHAQQLHSHHQLKTEHKSTFRGCKSGHTGPMLGHCTEWEWGQHSSIPQACRELGYHLKAGAWNDNWWRLWLMLSIPSVEGSNWPYWVFLALFFSKAAGFLCTHIEDQEIS